MDAPAAIPEQFAPIGHQIAELRDRLTTPMGRVLDRWRNRYVEPRELTEAVVAWLHSGLGSPRVILNEPALRAVELGDVLTLADLLAVEPFANELVHAPLPWLNGDLQLVLEELSDRAGPLVTAPAVLTVETRAVLTTSYLAETFPANRAIKAGLTLGGAVCHVLTGAGPAVQVGTAP